MIYNSIDDKSLNNSLWLLKNISRIRFFIKFLLFVFIVATYSFFIWNVVLMLQSYNQYNSLYKGFLVDSMSNYSSFNSYLKENIPLSLNIKSQGFSQGYSKVYYDFYALIVNPNTKYKLDSFDYYFIYNGDLKTPVKTEYIPLDSEKYILSRGILNAEGNVENPQIVVENLKWSLVDLNPKRPTSFVDTNIPYDCEIQKNNLVSSEEKINNLKDGSSSVNVFSFKITNNSLNNYNIVNNKIIFFNKAGNINYIVEKEISKLRSKESYSMSVNLPSYLQDFGNVLVLSEVNMCKEDFYMPKDIINTGI